MVAAVKNSGEPRRQQRRQHQPNERHDSPFITIPLGAASAATVVAAAAAASSGDDDNDENDDHNTDNDDANISSSSSRSSTTPPPPPMTACQRDQHLLAQQRQLAQHRRQLALQLHQQQQSSMAPPPTYKELQRMLLSLLGVVRSIEFTCYSCKLVKIDPVELPCHHQICRQCLSDSVTYIHSRPHFPLFGVSEGRLPTLRTLSHCVNQPLMAISNEPFECGLCRHPFEWWHDRVQTNHGDIVVARARLYEHVHGAAAMAENLPHFRGFTDGEKTDVHLRCVNPACAVVLPAQDALLHSRTCRALRCPCPFIDCHLSFDLDFSESPDNASYAQLSSTMQNLSMRETYKRAWIRHSRNECRHRTTCLLDECADAVTEEGGDIGRRIFLCDEIAHFHMEHLPRRIDRCANLFANAGRQLTVQSAGILDSMLAAVESTMISQHPAPLIVSGGAARGYHQYNNITAAAVGEEEEKEEVLQQQQQQTLPDIQAEANAAAAATLGGEINDFVSPVIANNSSVELVGLLQSLMSGDDTDTDTDIDTDIEDLEDAETDSDDSDDNDDENAYDNDAPQLLLPPTPTHLVLLPQDQDVAAASPGGGNNDIEISIIDSPPPPSQEFVYNFE